MRTCVPQNLAHGCSQWHFLLWNSTIVEQYYCGTKTIVGKGGNRPTADGGMHKQTVACLCNEILFGNERNKVQTYATLWMNVKNISVIEKARRKYHMVLFT